MGKDCDGGFGGSYQITISDDSMVDLKKLVVFVCENASFHKDLEVPDHIYKSIERLRDE